MFVVLHYQAKLDSDIAVCGCVCVCVGGGGGALNFGKGSKGPLRPPENPEQSPGDGAGGSFGEGGAQILAGGQEGHWGLLWIQGKALVKVQWGQGAQFWQGVKGATEDPCGSRAEPWWLFRWALMNIIFHIQPTLGWYIAVIIFDWSTTVVTLCTNFIETLGHRWSVIYPVLYTVHYFLFRSFKSNIMPPVYLAILPEY